MNVRNKMSLSLLAPSSIHVQPLAHLKLLKGMMANHAEHNQKEYENEIMSVCHLKGLLHAVYTHLHCSIGQQKQMLEVCLDGG